MTLAPQNITAVTSLGLKSAYAIPLDELLDPSDEFLTALLQTERATANVLPATVTRDDFSKIQT